MRIKGKGIVSIDQKMNGKNVLYVGGIKNSLLSVSHMCDNGYNVNFQSKNCEIQNDKNEKLVGKADMTHNKVYVFDDSRVNYYLSKKNEAKLWHRRLGHMNFSSLMRVNKIGAMRGFLRLSRTDNSI